MFIQDLATLETPMLLVGPIQDDFKRFLRELISTNNLKSDLLSLMYVLMVSVLKNVSCYHLSMCSYARKRIYNLFVL